MIKDILFMLAITIRGNFGLVLVLVLIVVGVAGTK